MKTQILEFVFSFRSIFFHFSFLTCVVVVPYSSVSCPVSLFLMFEKAPFIFPPKPTPVVEAALVS